jgi:cytochrome c-type biogenesis protein CcmH/NrfF
LRRTAIVAFLAAVSSVQAADNRLETLGDALACMCSCTQLLGRCEMINCPSAPPLRKELQQQIDSGKDDAGILAYFSEKYGPKILSAPPAKGWFNISAWVMPFAVLVAGALFVMLFLKRLRPAVAAPSTPAVDASKYESQIEEELRKLTPED